jgi:hypothetical protein
MLVRPHGVSAHFVRYMPSSLLTDLTPGTSEATGSQLRSTCRKVARPSTDPGAKQRNYRLLVSPMGF